MRLMLIAAVVVATTALAQPLKNAAERAKDRQDLRQDNRQMADDKWDLAKSQKLLADYDAAAAKNNTARLAELDALALKRIDVEIAESHVESAQARQEIREDNREIHGDKKELAKDVVKGKGPLVKADDVHDLNRDKVNRADDVADAAKERISRERLQAIRAQLVGLSGRFDPPSVGTKRALYAEVVGIAGNEVVRDAKEKVEDKRELREDRRETREDRRQKKK